MTRSPSTITSIYELPRVAVNLKVTCPSAESELVIGAGSDCAELDSAGFEEAAVSL